MYNPHDSAIHRSQHKMTGPATAQKTKRVQAVARFPIRAKSKVKAIFALLKWSEKSEHTLKQKPQKDVYTYAAAAAYINIHPQRSMACLLIFTLKLLVVTWTQTRHPSDFNTSALLWFQQGLSLMLGRWGWKWRTCDSSGCNSPNPNWYWEDPLCTARL